jgi:hypothetical protein
MNCEKTPLGIKNENIKKYVFSKKEREKLKRMSQAFGRVKWMLANFCLNLNL